MNPESRGDKVMFELVRYRLGTIDILPGEKEPFVTIRSHCKREGTRLCRLPRQECGIVPQFDKVSVIKSANVYFDGKCVSHSILFPDGSKKSIGVIFPSTLTFNTFAPESMEINAGECRVRLAGNDEWTTYGGGERFSLPGDSSFEIETVDMLDYVCHFG